MRGPTSSSGASPSTTINKGEKRRGKRVLAESLVLIEVAQYEVEGEGEGERGREEENGTSGGDFAICNQVDDFFAAVFHQKVALGILV